MCFAFQHLNFQKWSERGVLCTFWLGNVLRATTACTFSTVSPPRLGLRLWYMTTVSIETYIDVFEHCISRALTESWERIGNILQVTWEIWYKVWGTSCMLLDEDDTTYQEHHSRFLKKLWQRARNVLQVTCRRFHNVSGTCCKSLEEDVTTYQEHLASYLKKSLQRIRKVVQVTYK